jgi:hypothetical protein
VTDKQSHVDDSPDTERDAGELGTDEAVVAEAVVEPAPAELDIEADDRIIEVPDSEADAAFDPEDEPEPEPEVIDPEEIHALAALALGVAPSGGESDFQARVASSPALQRELASLIAVADILTSLYQAQAAPAPSQAEAPAATSERARISVPGRRADAATAPDRPITARRPERQLQFGRFSTLTIASVGLAIVAALAVLWAFALLDRIATRDDEIAALNEQLAQMQQAANASAFVLTPTSDDAPGVGGTIFYSISDRTALLDVSGLPELDEGEVYQIWFQGDGSDEWVLGPAFRVNSQGESVQRLPGDTPAFARVAISREAGPGSDEPSGDFLLEGNLAGGNG